MVVLSVLEDFHLKILLDPNQMDFREPNQTGLLLRIEMNF